MIVMKFGGSSVANAERIKHVASIIKAYKEKRPIVVLSAMGDTTDHLLEAADLAVSGVVDVKGVAKLHEETALTLGVNIDTIKALLDAENVEIRGDERAMLAAQGILPASEEDFAEEYLDYIISVKSVDNLDEAINHINRYSTKHSEAIITENEENARQFLARIDSAAVYVNASTRFTDGGEFGLGAEIGISTQKLHARGPMGLRELTTTKYLIYGNGQVR